MRFRLHVFSLTSRSPCRSEQGHPSFDTIAALYIERQIPAPGSSE